MEKLNDKLFKNLKFKTLEKLLNVFIRSLTFQYLQLQSVRR